MIKNRIQLAQERDPFRAASAMSGVVAPAAHREIVEGGWAALRQWRVARIGVGGREHRWQLLETLGQHLCLIVVERVRWGRRRLER